MIQANELRIGNWYDDYGNYKQVTPNDILKAWESERFWMEPILLTPEILEKCGFEFQHIGNYIRYSSEFTFIELDNDGDFYHVFIKQKDTTDSNICDVVILDCNVSYLHQLQNLYYALTQTELIVNL